jgi:hypothetical protein
MVNNLCDVMHASTDLSELSFRGFGISKYGSILQEQKGAPVVREYQEASRGLRMAGRATDHFDVSA